MKQDINEMISIINNELGRKESTFSFNDIIREIINMLGNNTVDEELEIQVLKEMYKFIKLGETMTSIDPRGDESIKQSAIYGIKESLSNNSLTKDNIESLKFINELCLDYYLNPLKLKKQASDFNSKHPDAKF